MANEMLKGFQDLMGGIAAKKETEERAGVKQQASDAYTSADYNKLGGIIAKNSWLKADFDKMIGWKNEQTKQNAIETVSRVKNSSDILDKKRAVADRIKFLLKQKADPTRSLEIYKDLQAGNEQSLNDEVGFLDSVYGSGGGDTGKRPTTAMGQFIKNNPDATSEELIKFTQDLKGPSLEEKKEERGKRTAVNLQNKLKEVGANKFFNDHKYRLDDDGSLYIDPDTKKPTKLGKFTDALGKRGNVKAVLTMGEQWDDAKELMELLELPSVKKNLTKAKNDGLWDQVKGKWNNKINLWMQNNGIKGDSPTATAIARTQLMASNQRKEYMGTAVTEIEAVLAQAWLPSAGDSYETMVNKTRLVAHESEQAFRRWMDAFNKDTDMSPFYKAFGIKRFKEKADRDLEINTDTPLDSGLPVGGSAPPEAIEYLKANPQFKDQFQQKYGYLPEGL